MGGFGFRSAGWRRGPVVIRLAVASLVTMAGALGAVALSGAAPAGAIGSTYYAYPAGGTTTPLSCPQTTIVADQCTLTQALAVVGAGDTVALAVAGIESDPSTWYVGNFSVSGGSGGLASPLVIEPAAGVSNPILDGNGGSSIGCPTGSCNLAVLTIPSGAFVDVSGVTVQNADNTNFGGGGIQNNGALDVSGSTFRNDQSSSFGGAINNDMVANVTGSTFVGNQATLDGGAVDSAEFGADSTLTVRGSSFSSNNAAIGGAIANAANGGTGALTVASSTFSQNTADSGAAVINGESGGNATATVTSSTFDHNAALTEGGAIDTAKTANATIQISDSTLWANSARFTGGAVENGANVGSGTLDISDSTLVGNQAGGSGAAVNSEASGGTGTVTISSSTIVANIADNEAIFAPVGTNTLTADIVAESGPGKSCYGLGLGKITDGGFNVGDDGSCGFSGTSVDNPAIDHYFGGFGLYGGTTETIPLNASPNAPVGPDPALETIPAGGLLPDGTPICSIPDQRGVVRTAPCDVGAYETHITGVESAAALVGSATSATAGDSVTYTATVVPITDDEPGSAVTFIQDGVPATCAGYSFDGQTATCTLTYPVPGAHQVTATYGGDNVFAPSSPSAPWTVNVAPVAPAPTATTLISSATGVAPGQSLTLTATVTPIQSGLSPGAVTFEDDGQPLMCGAGSTAFDGTTATCVVIFPAPSLPQHEVTAVYSGDATATGSTSSPLLITVAFANPGYRVAAADGGVFAFGAPYDGSMGGQHLNAPIVGMATDTATGGYWLVASDGGIFSFDAPFHGSMGGQPLNQPIVGMAATADGTGYWEVAADGGIFAFGTAAFHGSMGGQHLNAPVVGMAPDNATGGYWEDSSDGGIFSFGAPFDGSTGSLHLDAPMVGMAATPDGGGYWLAASDGGVFTYGDAAFHGSNADTNLASPIVGVAADIYTGGYWLVAANGATHAYGAPEDGQFPDLGGASRAVAIAPG
ncbi:MAG TPA: Ig-like domain-containing protein [Acidimicrobiales bacterium]|nr:Ig-like domain-containing protein [Acidimicrobiales bacterium]